MRLHPMRPQPARQPEAVPTSFEGQCNPRDLTAGLTASSRQRCSRSAAFLHSAPASCAVAAQCREAYRQPATRLAHFDDGNDRAILVQGDEGTCSSRSAGASGHSISWLQRRWYHFLAACPIPSLRWREMDSNQDQAAADCARRRRAGRSGVGCGIHGSPPTGRRSFGSPPIEI
jgi:hypothetical protein